MPPLLLKLIFNRIEKSSMPCFVKPIAKGIAGKVTASFVAPRIADNLDHMEAELGNATWFAGEAMTGADIQVSFVLEACQARGGLDESRPRLIAFL